MVIVDVQESFEGRNSFGLRRVGADVGPLFEHGSVESLNFSVGLRSIGTGLAVDDVTERLAEEAAAITRAVVRHDFEHVDAVVIEPGLRPGPEARGRLFLLVRKNLGVGEATVVVNGRVDEAVAGTPLGVRGSEVVVVPLGASEDLPAAAVRDAAQFFDVDVDQVAGALAFVAADDLTRGSVHPLQAIESSTTQHPVHR